MSDVQVPDYDLPDEVHVDGDASRKAMADPLRRAVLDLVLERAASVTELSEALGRPKSTLAYHVDVLVDVGLLCVVRTRRVRAVEERFYGRTGRTIVLGPTVRGGAEVDFLAEAAAEAVDLEPPGGSTLRHARIPAEAAEEFFARVAALADEFTRLPRGGGSVYGFVAAVYVTDHPTLPARSEES